MGAARRNNLFSPGIRNPWNSVAICVGVTLAAWISIAWGIMEMQAAGQETVSSGLKIGLALLPAIIAPMLIWNFWSGVKVIAAIRRGENAIARWTLTAAELAEFTAGDKARTEHRKKWNDWSPPRKPPATGIEVIFVKDGVLVGDTYFALITTGLFRFTGVQMLADAPPAVAFQTVTTYANRFGTRTMTAELRVPVSRDANAEAAKVVAHYQAVRSGHVITNPNFYKRRIRLGLTAAPVFLAIAGVGFLLPPGESGPNSVSVRDVMIAAGLIFGIAALILAGAARLLDGKQRRKG